MKDRFYIDEMTHPPCDPLDQTEDIEEIKNELIRLKAEIHRWESRGEGDGLSAKLREVEEIYAKVKAELHKRTASGEVALKDLKEGLYTAWRDLKESVERASRRFD